MRRILAVLAYVLHEYPGLSQSVALRFPALGGITRVSDKSALLDIPRSGLGFMAVNLILAVILHSWERMVGYVLLLAGIAVLTTTVVREGPARNVLAGLLLLLVGGVMACAGGFLLLGVVLIAAGYGDEPAPPAAIAVAAGIGLVPLILGIVAFRAGLRRM